MQKLILKKDQKVIQYIGDKVTKREGDKRADKQIRKAKKDKNNGMVYVFELNKRYDIDGDVDYNFAKFINHSCNPNCEVDIIDNEIWISSIKRIKKVPNFFITMVILLIQILWITFVSVVLEIVSVIF